jgi:hypothetical protein
VHLVADGASIAFVMKQAKAPLLSNALYCAEDMATQLTNWRGGSVAEIDTR